MIIDTEAFKRERRLPTREEFDAAMEVIGFCNGFDLSEWTDTLWPDDSLGCVIQHVRHAKRKL